MKLDMILATYLVWHVKEGVWSDDENKVFQTSESVVMPSMDITIDDMKDLFKLEMDKKFGINKWKLEYYLGMKEVNSVFFVEKSILTTLEGELFLKGTGDYSGHCHSLYSVKDLLSSKLFITNNIGIVPFFQTAQEMMEDGQIGYVRPMEIRHGQKGIYEPI